MSERYAKLESEIHVHFLVRINRNGPITGYLHLIFNGSTYPRLDGTCTREGQVLKDSVCVIRCAEDTLPLVEQRQMNQTMFVEVGELTERPEGMIQEFIPSTVRLQSFDDCLRLWVEASDLRSMFPCLHHSSTEDRKLEPLCKITRQRGDASARDGKIIYEIV